MIRPDRMKAGGDGSRRRMVRQNTDLPLPDSPTMPNVRRVEPTAMIDRPHDTVLLSELDHQILHVEDQ
jgi:hypothetical protein